MSLKTIVKIEDCAKSFSTSTRIRLNILNSKYDLGLKFTLSNKEEFMGLLNKMILKRSWEVFEKAQEAENAKRLNTIQNQQFSVSNAGVGGIIRRQEKNMEALDSVSKTALSDLNALMQQAKEVIALIRRFASHDSAENDDDNETRDDSSAMSSARSIL